MDVHETAVAGSRVGIVGGSIAGCAAAFALRRLGCEVTVFERSSGALRDRGSGIAIPIPLRDELVGAGYLPDDYDCFGVSGRHWYLADGSPTGRLLWDQPGVAVTNNWGVLWRSLRALVPDETYRDGSRVESVVDRSDAVDVVLADAGTEAFDVVVGADGYLSTIRAQLQPGSLPDYAGYILWRGNFPASRLADTTQWDEVVASRRWCTVVFDGGHGVMYPIPDFDGRGLRVNWAIYAPQPAELVLDAPGSIPPGQVPLDVFARYEELLARHFPAAWLPVFTSPHEEVSIQPVYDEAVDRYVRGRIALIGDAATVARPHSGSGATKAMQDARLLETLASEHDTWGPLLAAYDADRTPAGRALVDVSRRIGWDQVEHTPPWASMTPDDFHRWTAATMAGQQLYLYQNLDDQESADVRGCSIPRPGLRPSDDPHQSSSTTAPKPRP